MLHQTEKGENVVMEIENGLAESTTKKKEPAMLKMMSQVPPQ